MAASERKSKYGSRELGNPAYMRVWCFAYRGSSGASQVAYEFALTTVPLQKGIGSYCKFARHCIEVHKYYLIFLETFVFRRCLFATETT